LFRFGVAASASTVTLEEFNGAFNTAAYCTKQADQLPPVTAFPDADNENLAIGSHFVDLSEADCVGPGLSWKVREGFETNERFQTAVLAQQLAISALPATTPAMYIGRVARNVLASTGRKYFWTLATNAMFDTMSWSAGRNYFLLYLTPEQKGHLLTSTDFELVIALPPALKQSPEVIEIGAANVAEYSIALSPGAMQTQAAAQTLAGEWKQALTANGAATGEFEAQSNDLIVLKGIAATDSLRGMNVVLDQKEAQFMEPAVNYSVNNADAAYIVQSGDAAKKSTPLWDRGLHGEGEVVGVADSGLDHQSCFFFDVDNPVTIPAARGAGQVAPTYTSATHRKIVQVRPVRRAPFSHRTASARSRLVSKAAGCVPGCAPVG
jgi:hypothetical protein